ncbi:hypothetical protein AB0L75_11385 [Streptomyces sp. NPDC052101]|uniref:hypothetical protein n=1 Tax=Streptomyces sp. NPDC052101 TaxID=3155763 RepID=UPI003447F2D9
MDIATCLTVIDSLCAGEFPAAHGRTEHGESGPAFHMAALETSGDFSEDDGPGREETAAQYEADRDALAERMAQRWGPAQYISLYSVLERTTLGEDIPQPWAGLGGHVPDVMLWQPPGTGRWLALGVSQWTGHAPFQLLAVVTTVDPP